MDEKTVERLKTVGWSKDRKIDVSYIVEVLAERGFDLSDKNIGFLEQFGMLEFEIPNRCASFEGLFCIYFNPIKAVGNNMYKYSLEYLEDEYSEIENIDTLVPIGETDDRNMLILSTKDNVFYGYTDGCLVKYGDTVEDMLDCLIGTCRLPEEMY